MTKVNREEVMALINSKPDGQRVKNFCAEKGITEAFYYYWHNRLNKSNKGDSSPSGFIPVRIKDVIANGHLLASIDLPGKAVIHVYDAAVIPMLRHIL